MVDYIRSTKDSLGYLLVLLFPVIKVNGKLQQLNPGRIAETPDPSEMKVMAPGEEPRLADVLVEGARNIEWVVEEESYKYYPKSHEQFQKQGL